MVICYILFWFDMIVYIYEYIDIFKVSYFKMIDLWRIVYGNKGKWIEDLWEFL